jgi:lipoprotein NlpD
LPALTSQMTLNDCVNKKALLKRLMVLWQITALLGCSVSGPVPVLELPQPPIEKINLHWVSKGETLYAIAWRYDVDPMNLARANGLQQPFTVVEGQKLSLLTASTPLTAPVVNASKQAVVSKPKQTSIKVIDHSPAKPLALGAWQWPAVGKVSTGFTQVKNAAHKGIDISGNYGQPVTAANHGVVVYSGSGLAAYGKLLIIKHSDTYLSAYAHNSRLLVAIGSKVKAGEKIAEIGRSGTTHNHLHFEIRKKGRPVNPMSLLPKK